MTKREEKKHQMTEEGDRTREKAEDFVQKTPSEVLKDEFIKRKCIPLARGLVLCAA